MGAVDGRCGRPFVAGRGAARILRDLALEARLPSPGFDPSRDSVDCSTDESGDRVRVHYDLPRLGYPELVFDATSAALRSAHAHHADGSPFTMVFPSWTESKADGAGVLWPLAFSPASRKEPTVLSPMTMSAGTCSRGEADQECFGAPSAPVEVDLGEEPVVVPMTFDNSELLVDAEVGGHTVRAMLDTGAGVSLVLPNTSVASAFRSWAATTALQTDERPFDAGVWNARSRGDWQHDSTSLPRDHRAPARRRPLRGAAPRARDWLPLSLRRPPCESTLLESDGVLCSPG